MTVHVVAFGGGHGLSASLRALTDVKNGGSAAPREASGREPGGSVGNPTSSDIDITAVVTVGDDGGSSGRLRAERDALPPGDLRQALAALAGPGPAGTVADLFQFRFASGQDARHDPLAGHAVGNLVLCGLFEMFKDPVVGLDHAAAMVHAQGRVLPMSPDPIGIEADVRHTDGVLPRMITVVGQHSVALAEGDVEAVRLIPTDPPACDEAVRAVARADWLIFGPGSWFTSVIPHLLVPDLARAILASPAKRLVILNLALEKETKGLSLPDHLDALTRYLPGLRVDVVLADRDAVGDPEPVRRAARDLGADLVLATVAAGDGSPRHDPAALAAALAPVLTEKQ
jgi:uncharacterized cofD-like protein